MMFRNTLRRGLTFTLLGLALATPLSQAADTVSLTLYNGQHKEVGDAIAKAFEAKTGIHVNVRKGSSNQLASQVVEEGDRSPADVIYTEESPPLNKLGEQGLLAKADAATLDDRLQKPHRLRTRSRFSMNEPISVSVKPAAGHVTRPRDQAVPIDATIFHLIYAELSVSPIESH